MFRSAPRAGIRWRSFQGVDRGPGARGSAARPSRDPAAPASPRPRAPGPADAGRRRIRGGRERRGGGWIGGAHRLPGGSRQRRAGRMNDIAQAIEFARRRGPAWPGRRDLGSTEPITEISEPGVEEFYLVGRDLPAPPAGRSYRVWLVSGTDPDVRRRVPARSGRSRSCTLEFDPSMYDRDRDHGRVGRIGADRAARSRMADAQLEVYAPRTGRSALVPDPPAVGQADAGAVSEPSGAERDARRNPQNITVIPARSADEKTARRRGRARDARPDRDDRRADRDQQRADEPVPQLGAAAHPPCRPKRAGDQQDVRRDRR